jgi:RNA polymerase sigma-70 factor (ECF subfamily)
MRAAVGWELPMIAEAEADERSRADRAMDRYADGDEGAFEILYDELAPRLHRYALRETRSRSGADDTVQQVLLNIHAARARFVRGAAVLPWAYAIARRLLIDGRRDATRWASVEEGAEVREAVAVGRAVDDALDQRRREADLERDLRLLPPKHREAFSMVKLEGLSIADTASVLGITQGNVKVRVHRAVEALRTSDARRRRKP